MRVESGPGLERIVAEERDDAAAYERDRGKIDDALDHLPRTIALLLALALGPALLVHRPGLVDLRPRARDVIRPRVRAGAADRDRARARAVAARPGRHARIAGVHGDAVRPDPPGPLPRRAGDDGAEDLGRPQDPAGRGSRALARRRRGAGRGVRGAGRPGRRRDPRRRAGAPLALPRPDRGRPDGELGALHRLQVGGRGGDLGPEVVQQRRARRAARRCGRPRRRGRPDAASAGSDPSSRSPPRGAASSRSRSASAGSWARPPSWAPRSTAASGAAALRPRRRRPSAGRRSGAT